MERKINVLVCSSAKEEMWKLTKEEGLHITYAYRGHYSNICSVVGKIWRKLKLPFCQIWYSKKVKDLTGVCVLMDADTTPEYCEWLIKNNRADRMIYYYWNAYEPHKISPDALKKMGYEVWSFDPENCKEYDLKYNEEFYCRSWYKGLENIEVKYDIGFIGRDKNGRMEQVEALKKRFSDQDISWDLYFTANKWYQRFWNKKYRAYLKFGGMLRKEMEYGALLDYSQSAQSSITCRVYDAICNSRKVVTNNKEIRKAAYYSPENIFILDYDDDSRLSEFLKTPFRKIDDEIMRKKSFTGWKSRFFT